MRLNVFHSLGKPARFRLASPPRRLKVSIELGEGFAAAEIDADAAAITAVGTRRLPAPVRRDAAVAPSLVDGDRDGLPELVVAFPAKPLLRRLKAGRANRLALEGPLTTWGRFVGSAALRVLP